MADKANEPGLRDVHIFAVVRVKVTGIKADSDHDAINKAEEKVDLTQLFNRVPVYKDVAAVEFAEEISHFLVDNISDKEFENSAWYKPKRKLDGYEDMYPATMEAEVAEALYHMPKNAVRIVDERGNARFIHGENCWVKINETKPETVSCAEVAMALIESGGSLQIVRPGE